MRRLLSNWAFDQLRQREPIWLGYLTLYALSDFDLERMRPLMEQYRDASMDLVDASLVAAAETLGLQSVFTLGKHFYAYRLPNAQAFSVVP